MTESATATSEYRDKGLGTIVDNKYGRRVVSDLVVRIIGYAILLFMSGLMIAIVGYVGLLGITHITPKMLVTVGNTSSGGLLNAIVGTWELVGFGLIISLPVGVFGGIYLSEYSTRNTGGVLRLFVDILTSVPSIVLGLFGYLVLVVQLDLGFSIVAGGFVLGAMMIPYILRISEISYSNIPGQTREAAFALGADSIQVSTRLLIPQARVGILTATLLAVSIAAGETAQLLYTAEWNNGFTTSLIHSPVAYLTYPIYYSLNQPTAYAHALAYSAAFILVASIFLLLLISKYFGRGR